MVALVRMAHDVAGAATEKAMNGGELGAAWAKHGPLGLAGLALAAAIWAGFGQDQRPDPATGTMLREVESRLNARLDHMEELHEAHASIDAHEGAGRILAAMKVQLGNIEKNVSRNGVTVESTERRIQAIEVAIERLKKD